MTAGVPSKNYGKPFSYISSCLPGRGRKVDSNRSDGSSHSLSSSASRTRQFMMSLQEKNMPKLKERLVKRNKESIVTNPYSLHLSLIHI